jgi:hypothetical protein
MLLIDDHPRRGLFCLLLCGHGTAQPDLHDIGWAVQQLLNGDRVRRATWNRGEALAMRTVEGKRLIIDQAGGKGPSVLTEDLLATDWELA